MERGTGTLSAVQEVNNTHVISVISIINLNDLIDYLQTRSELSHQLQAVAKYRQQYGESLPTELEALLLELVRADRGEAA